tara:strand:- start:1495 stop:2751 length:1257 start_codon:yes stop_codon:yes gene_type:complete
MKSYSQALKILKESKIFIKNEYIKSSKSLNRVCAKNIYSNTLYPSADNSSFDGFAINSKDTKNLSKKKSKLFKILGTIAAGNKPSSKKIKKFQTFAIMTGGLLPNGFDTIIPIEKIIFYPSKKKPKFIIIDKKIPKNNNVRFAGSDYKKGDKIISSGEIINSSHILALKTLGIEKINVKKKPLIVFYSTGNEISEKNNIPDWKVRNSNIHYIKSLSKNLFFDLIDGGILRDNDDQLFKKIINKNFNSKYDIIITNGAVSAGKFDFVPKVIKKFKLSKYFKGLAIRPGKPIMFAKFKNKEKSFFGLPGNPISSAACFRFFVYPYLLNILGVKSEKSFKARLKNKFEKKKNFTRFLKSKLITTKSGNLYIEVLTGQESFRIKSFVKSNVWSLFKAGKSTFKKNEIIDCYIPLGWDKNHFL